MKKNIVSIYNSVFFFFHKKIGSNRYTSQSASISIISLIIIGLFALLINTLFIILTKHDFIKNTNQWIILITLINPLGVII